MLPFKLVLDTNIIISAHLKPEGLERAVLNFALTPPALMFVSKAILKEYQNVLKRPKFKIDPTDSANAIKLISTRAVLLKPPVRLNITLDPDDNIFLECAQAARADYLATGNQKHFPAFWRNTKIINSRELMKIIAPHQFG